MRTAVKARQNVFMRAVVQRVDGASVVVEGQTIGAFDGPGLLVLIGVSVCAECSTGDCHLRRVSTNGHSSIEHGA